MTQQLDSWNWMESTREPVVHTGAKDYLAQKMEEYNKLRHADFREIRERGRNGFSPSLQRLLDSPDHEEDETKTRAEPCAQADHISFILDPEPIGLAPKLMFPV